jgi:hypothetical protein
LTGWGKVYKIGFEVGLRGKEFPLLSIPDLEKGKANPWKR